MCVGSSFKKKCSLIYTHMSNNRKCLGYNPSSFHSTTDLTTKPALTNYSVFKREPNNNKKS
jgi:hypothetical protein